MISKKISVIVPVYNTSPDFINAALGSLYKQTYQNLEIIVVDDGSTVEKTIKYLKSVNNPKVKLITQKNGGLGRARNIGLQYATGDYIGFLDSDDWVSSDFYEVLLNMCEASRADMACALLIRTDEYYEKPMNKPDNTVTDDLLRKISYITNGSVCDKLFRKELVSDIRFDEGILYEDNPFLIKSLIKSHNVFFTNKTKYFYRVNEKSIVLNTALSIRRRTDKIKVLKKISKITETIQKNSRDALLNIFAPILVEKNYLITNYKYRCQIRNILGDNYLSYCKILISDKIINLPFFKYLFIIRNFISKIMSFILSIHNSRDKKYKIIKFLGYEVKMQNIAKKK